MQAARPPRSASPICDLNAGMFGAIGILTAYINRLRTGQGQHVDTSLLEGGIAYTFWESAMYFATGRGPRAQGQRAPLDGAVPGVRDVGRIRQHRRGEPGQLGAPLRRHRPRRACDRSPFRRAERPYGQHRRAGVHARRDLLPAVVGPLAGKAGRCRGPSRPDLRPRRGICRPAGAGAGDDGRDRAPPSQAA